MPGYKAHISFAGFWYCIVLFIVCRLYNPSTLFLLELAFCIMLGALFPDIDIKSKGQKYIYTGFFIGAIPLLFMKQYIIVAFAGWLCCIPMMVKHRGIFHDPLYMSFFILVGWYVLYLYYPVNAIQYIWHFICFIIGMHSHMVLDYGVMSYVKKLTKQKKKKFK